MEQKTTSTENERRLYAKPEIVKELELETRAGSPMGIPDPLNLRSDEFP